MDIFFPLNQNAYALFRKHHKILSPFFKMEINYRIPIGKDSLRKLMGVEGAPSSACESRSGGRKVGSRGHGKLRSAPPRGGRQQVLSGFQKTQTRASVRSVRLWVLSHRAVGCHADVRSTNPNAQTQNHLPDGTFAKEKNEKCPHLGSF